MRTPGIARSKTVLIAVAVLLAVAALPDAAFAQRRDDRRQRSEPTYALVRLGDDVRMLLTTEVRELLEWEKKRYAEELAKYNKARAAAKRQDREFHDRKPEPRTVKVLDSNIRGRDLAEVKRERYLAKIRSAGLPSIGKAAFVVVELGGEYRIMSRSELSDLKATLDAEYERALAAHERAVDQARRDGQRNLTPAPQKPKLRMLKRTFRTEAEARQYLRDRIRAEEERREARDDARRG